MGDVTAIYTGHNICVEKVGNNFGFCATVRTACGRLVGTTDCYGTDRAAFNMAIDIAEADFAKQVTA